MAVEERTELRLIPLSDGRLSVEIWLAGEALAHIKLDAPTLSATIDDLATFRAAIADDPIPESLDPGSRLTTVVHPAYKMKEVGDERALALRHPGLGWLSFLLSQEQAQQLALSLAKP